MIRSSSLKTEIETLLQTILLEWHWKATLEYYAPEKLAYVGMLLSTAGAQELTLGQLIHQIGG